MTRRRRITADVVVAAGALLASAFAIPAVFILTVTLGIAEKLEGCRRG